MTKPKPKPAAYFRARDAHEKWQRGQRLSASDRDDIRAYLATRPISGTKSLFDDIDTRRLPLPPRRES